MKKSGIILTAVLISFFIASLLCFSVLPYPFLWLLSSTAALALWLTMCCRRVFFKAAYFNILFISLVFLLFECWFAYQSYLFWHSTFASTGVARNAVFHELLGYAPRCSSAYQSRLVHEGKEIYNVTYTIDEKGLRISPGRSACVESILCFGCSFTFGEGLPDSAALPFRIAEMTTLCVYNFGYHGYGPQQMLRVLETKLEQKALPGRPRYLIYQAIPDHVRRAAGRETWGRPVPRYFLNQAGQAQYSGLFNDEYLVCSNRAAIAVTDILVKSESFKKALRLCNRFLGSRMIGQDVPLCIAIIDRARAIFEQRYPGAEFHVIVWDDGSSPYAAAFIKGLRARPLRLHYISDILPGYQENPAQYYISPHDVHPNAKAFDILSQYIRTNIMYYP